MPNKNYNAQYNSFDGGGKVDGEKKSGSGFIKDSNSTKKKTKATFKTFDQNPSVIKSGKGYGSNKKKD